MRHDELIPLQTRLPDVPEIPEFPPPDMERAVSVIRAALGPTILPRETDPIVGAQWLAELARRRAVLAERLLAEADALRDAASQLLLRRRGRMQRAT